MHSIDLTFQNLVNSCLLFPTKNGSGLLAFFSFFFFYHSQETEKDLLKEVTILDW